MLAEAAANNITLKPSLNSIENSNSVMHLNLRPAKDLVLFLAYEKSNVKVMMRHEPHKLEMRIDGTGRSRWQPEVFECCPLPGASYK